MILRAAHAAAVAVAVTACGGAPISKNNVEGYSLNLYEDSLRLLI